MSTIENQHRYITIPATENIASVSAYPDEVEITVNVKDVVLSPEQARQLARFLSEAADLAERLEFGNPDDPGIDNLVLRAASTSPDSSKGPGPGTMVAQSPGEMSLGDSSSVPNTPDSGTAN